jgi:hypothetical protein
MMTYTLNNEKKAIEELELDELDIVSGGVSREKDLTCLDPLVKWVISWFE